MKRLEEIFPIKRVEIERLRPRAKDFLLLLIFLAGFWLRFDGLDWGHKSGIHVHPDEPRFIEQAEAFDRGGRLRKDYVFGFGAAIRTVHMVLPSLDYGRIGRVISLVSGSLLCLVVFVITRELKLRNAVAGLACALTALNTLCVIYSHYGTADMTYLLLLYLFALCVLRGWLLIAAIVAGEAMAMKFGLILVPSLLWLAWQQRARGILLIALIVFVFLAAQGFTFNSESVRMMWSVTKRDNFGGFEHQKWQNIITYLGVAIRALGIPVFIFAVIALARARWREALHGVAHGHLHHARIIAFLPFALHGIGLLAINTAFPRHALPLIPLATVVAACGIEKTSRVREAAALCLVWSGLLAWSDGRVFRDDPRERALREVQKIRASDSFKSTGKQAQLVTIRENRIGRFKRSEINPLRAPNERELYHASVDEFHRYQRFSEQVAHGRWKQVFEAGPLNVLPEQFLYDAAWGSFEKFAGKCTVYERSTIPP
jgi:hypothetical protein